MTTVGEHVVARLAEWGVHRYYGYPGDGVGGVMSALRKAVDDGSAEFVQVRHEETAAFAAAADVKYGGSELGCVVVTSGPGAIHALNGLYDAKLDHQPVVALLGHTALTAQGAGYYQEVDLLNLVKDVAGAYVAQVSDPSQVRHVIDRAARTALAQRTVTAVVLPSDVLVEDAVLEPPDGHGYFHTSAVPSTRPTTPPAPALQQAADLLNSGQKVAILAGAGALGATAELTAVADALDAGVAKALLGKTVLDDRLPWVTGSIGLLGTRASWDLMRGCDVLLVVGSNMPYSDFYPAPGQARAVQIDIDGAQCGLRYDTEVNLVGDAGPTLAALLPLLRTDRDGAWREQVGEWTHAWRETSKARVTADTHELNPEYVVRELSDRLPDDAVLAVDCGTATSFYARDIDVRPSMLGSLSGTLLSMGGGMPYALAAKFAHPDRPVFAVIGDGAMQMNGVNELITVSRYWKTWADPRFVVLVLNNRDLSFVTWEMRALVGDVPFAESQDLPDVPYADWAGLLGLGGRRISGKDEVPGLWEEALAADRPFVVDAVVDANVPLIPPHLTLQQVVNTAKSQLKGDPAAPLVIADGLREAVGAPARGLWHRAVDALTGG